MKTMYLKLNTFTSKPFCEGENGVLSIMIQEVLQPRCQGSWRSEVTGTTLPIVVEVFQV